MDLRVAHRFFSSRYYCVTLGMYFQGQLMAQPLTENTGYFLLARRMLKLDADSPVQGGHVIRTTGNLLYVAQEHATSEFNNTAVYKTLRMYEVTDLVTVAVPTVAEDDILGTVIDDGPLTPSGTAHCVIEPQSLEHDSLRNLTPVYRIITGVDIPVGAVLDGKYRITSKELKGGCYFLVAQKL